MPKGPLGNFYSMIVGGFEKVLNATDRSRLDDGHAEACQLESEPWAKERQYRFPIPICGNLDLRVRSVWFIFRVFNIEYIKNVPPNSLPNFIA